MSFSLVAVLGGNLHSDKAIAKLQHLAPFFEGSPWRSGRVLVNYYYHKKKESRDFLKGNYILMDSGGYQAKSMPGVNLDPKDVMLTQNRLCDLAIGLDDIPVKRTVAMADETLTAEYMSQQLNERMDPVYFEECARRTRDNLNEMLKVKDEKVKLYAPVHGATYAQRKRWMEICEEEHKFDGFAMKSNSFTDAINACALSHDFGDRNFHMLGVGLLSRALPFIYWGSTHQSKVTADTTSWAQGMMNRRYLDPILTQMHAFKSPNPKPVVGEDGELVEVKLPDDAIVWTDKGLPCNCVFCEQASKYEYNSLEFGLIMSSHNLYMMEDKSQKLQKMAPHRKLFDRSASELVKVEQKSTSLPWDRSTKLDIIKTFDVLDMIKEKGGEYIANKYGFAGRQDLEAFL